MQMDELAETFEMLSDWEERYRYLIELGRKLPPMPDSEKTETNKVRGCMSQVWLADDRNEGPPLKLHFRGDSDAYIVKGLIAVLFALYSDKTPQEILQTDTGEAFAKLGLEGHLTMNRRNGFYAMVERVKQTAQAAVAGSSSQNRPAASA